jgi:glycosyltransferase involved in cell wall biosynthesis
MLEMGPPAASWPHACFNAMVDYYDYFKRADATSTALARRQERSALEHCSAAIYASEWAAAAARRFHPPAASKIHVVPFGANLDPRYDRERVDALIEARPADKCSLLFVGVDWKRKGGPIALETAQLLNDSGLETTLTIVGCDPFGIRPAPAYVDVKKFLSLKRSSDRRTLCDLFGASDFLIVPSRAEAFGIVFCEAAAFGVPAVTTATGGIPTIVTDRANGLMLDASADPRDYAAAIREVFGDRQRYVNMARAAYNNYATRLNWRAAAAAVSRIVEQDLR